MSNLNIHEKASRIVNAVLDNLHGRKGIGDELDQIDGYVYKEMGDTLVLIVEKELADAERETS